MADDQPVITNLIFQTTFQGFSKAVLIIKQSYSKTGRMLCISLCVVLLAACSAPQTPPTAATPNAKAHVIVPSALPLSLLTPMSTPTFSAPSIPVRIENARLAMAVSVVPAEGALDQLGIPANQGGYWTQSAPLGQGGNTVIIGFAVTGVFDVLPKMQPSDRLLIADQYGLIHIYVVTVVEKAGDMASAVSTARPNDLTLISLTMSMPLHYFKVSAQPQM